MSDSVTSVGEWRRRSLSESTRRAEDEAAERLQSTSPLKDILKSLIKKSVPENKVNLFLDSLPRIIGDWEKIKNTSLRQRCNQSAKLAEKMRGLAKEIEEYSTTRKGMNMLVYGRIPFLLEWGPAMDKKDLVEEGLPGSPNLQYYLNHLARCLELESNQEFVGEAAAPHDGRGQAIQWRFKGVCSL